MKPARKKIYDKYGGRCAYCGNQLPDKWHADHMKPVQRYTEYCPEKKKYVFKGGMHNPQHDTEDNKVPACVSCNLNKHGMSPQEFREMLYRLITSLNKHSVQYQLAKRFGLIQETGAEINFHYEKQ